MRTFENKWNSPFGKIKLQKGSIEKLTGRKITWEDEPVEFKD